MHLQRPSLDGTLQERLPDLSTRSPSWEAVTAAGESTDCSRKRVLHNEQEVVWDPDLGDGALLQEDHGG